MKSVVSTSVSEEVRRYAVNTYLSPARRRQDRTFSVNVGVVHSALKLGNRVPLVCSALASKKFITENNLRLISKTGPPSGQSTTVTYAFEILERSQQSSMPQEPWTELRGVGKDIFAELGGGEAFLREERAQFSTAAKYREGESGSKV